MTKPEFKTQAEMDDKATATVRQMMESQAYRELISE